MARIEYHASTLAEIKAHASEDNVVIYIDNDIDAGSAEWETINIGSVSELHFQGHRLLRPYVKANNYLFSGGTVREAKILNVFENGSDYIFYAVSLIDCAISLRSSNTKTAIFNDCVFSRCNVNIELPNLFNASVFRLFTESRYPKDSLFTINGKLNGDIFLNTRIYTSNRKAAEGCRFDGKVTGYFRGFAYSAYISSLYDCIVNLDITDCNVAGTSHAGEGGSCWYNSDIFNKGNFPGTWKAVTSEQLTDPEYMKSVGLNVEIMG